MKLANVLAALLLVSASVPACSSTEEAGPTCPHVFWYRPAQAAGRVDVIGDFNGWKRPGVRLDPDGSGWLRTAVDLGTGEQRYVFVEDGATVLDPNVATSAFHEGEEVSTITRADCRLPELTVAEVTRDASKVEARLVLDRGEIDPASVDAEGLPVAVSGRELRVTWESASPGKKRVLVRLRDRAGNTVERLVSLWQSQDGTEFDPRDAIVYQIVVDRFRGDSGALAPPASPSGRAGGTLRGITSAIEKGELGAANAIWLSPLNQNPEGEFPGNDGRLYSSYHGYWPIAPRALDARLGTEDDLRGLVSVAHARGIRVILDVVPNHVHEQHPYAKTPGFAPAEGCTCGVGSCDWGTYIQSCRFAPYLPDLDWKNDTLARQVTEDIADWVDRFDLDGVRLDAVPMTPRAATRRIGAELRRRFEHPGAKLWMIGENFTGPDGYSLLRYHLGPFGLDTEFHFPLMWALRGAVATGTQPMSAIADSFLAGEKEWAGSGAVMGLMIGNHDVPRFATVSAGDADGDGWSPGPDRTTQTVFDKQQLALGLVFTLPGAPFLYYGDEITLFGRADPDARRVMPSLDSVSSEAARVRETTDTLARLRTCLPALRRGPAKFHFGDRERLVFSREDAERPVLVVATREPVAEVTGLEVPLEGLAEGNYVNVLTRETISVRPALTFLPGKPFSIQVFVRDGDPCLSR
jgi:glycosidase